MLYVRVNCISIAVNGIRLNSGMWLSQLPVALYRDPMHIIVCSLQVDILHRFLFVIMFICFQYACIVSDTASWYYEPRTSLWTHTKVVIVVTICGCNYGFYTRKFRHFRT